MTHRGRGGGEEGGEGEVKRGRGERRNGEEVQRREERGRGGSTGEKGKAVCEWIGKTWEGGEGTKKWEKDVGREVVGRDIRERVGREEEEKRVREKMKQTGQERGMQSNREF